MLSSLSGLRLIEIRRQTIGLGEMLSGFLAPAEGLKNPGKLQMGLGELRSQAHSVAEFCGRSREVLFLELLLTHAEGKLCGLRVGLLFVDALRFGQRDFGAGDIVFLA